MNLRTLAEQDLSFILEDKVNGFGWDITVTNPAGLSSTDLVGSSTDISQVIDPDTGEVVSGRSASVALRISSLVAVFGNDLPEGIADTSGKPWLVTFNDINGNPFTFKVQQSNPDRTIGIITLLLEFYIGS